MEWLARSPSGVIAGRVFEATTSRYETPVSVPEGDPLRLCGDGVHSHPQPFVVEMAHARVAGRFATIITPDDEILNESIHVVKQYWGWDDLSYRWKLKPVQRKAGRWISLPFIFGSSFHEWFIYTLPRVYLALRAGMDEGARYLLPAGGGPWIRESLSLIGVPPERCEEFDQGHWDCERLVFPSLPSDRPVDWACSWLREQALGLPRRSPTSRRVYVSRRKALTRRVLNEDDLLPLLHRFGFELFCPEELPLAEQLALFAQAEAVVGPHGAGLTNCLFASARCVVVEFIQPTHPFPCFFWIANARSQQYGYLVAEEVPQARYSEDVRFADLRVNAADLENLLARLLGC